MTLTAPTLELISIYRATWTCSIRGVGKHLFGVVKYVVHVERKSSKKVFPYVESIGTIDFAVRRSDDYVESIGTVLRHYHLGDDSVGGCSCARSIQLPTAIFGSGNHTAQIHVFYRIAYLQIKHQPVYGTTLDSRNLGFVVHLVGAYATLRSSLSVLLLHTPKIYLEHSTRKRTGNKLISLNKKGNCRAVKFISSAIVSVGPFATDLKLDIGVFYQFAVFDKIVLAQISA